MRLDKQIDIISEIKDVVDYDALGNPIYDTLRTYQPIRCQVEPFSKKLAEESYGVFVEATNRVFSEPSDLIELQAKVRYQGKTYEVTEIIPYDRHYETLIDYVGESDD